mmetsp:Transcript_22351/g.42197  ORF Transcript_22351/g.42197 Transcript_22351/m.42197 type:complete len:158 (+) Transcript_22351:489-962(+)
MHGYERDVTKAEKNLRRLKKFSPQLSDDGIQQMKEELVGLIAKNSPDEDEEYHDGHFSLVKAKADAGDASYMVELGELYLKGSGTPKDEQVGYHWFDLASNVQNELGTARKADCLLAGLGVQQNTAEGQTILTEAVLEDHSGKEDLMPSWMFAYHKQ